MADVKISALPAATTPLAGTEVLPIVQSATTDQVSVANLTAGRSVSAASLTLTTTPLAVGSGGTGLASLTTGYIPYGAGTSAFNNSANLTYSGTVLTAVGEIYASQAATNTQQIRLSPQSSGSNIIYSTYAGTNSYLPLVFNVGGSNRLTIDTSGNLGLGVTPSAWGSGYKAIGINSYTDIASTNAGTIPLSLTQNAYNNGTNWVTKITSTSKRYEISDSGFIWYNGASATAGGTITFTQAMTLDASGNLGVGETSPSTYGKLAVAGSIVAKSTAYATGTTGATFGYYTSGAYPVSYIQMPPSGGFAIWDSTTAAKLVLDTSGNLGIGISAPSTRLHVAGGNIQLDNNQAIQWGGGTNYIYGNNSTNILVFATNNTERARIDASGNVIINTAAIATTATDGFLYVPTCAGTPTGTPTTYTGRAPIVVNTTNNKLYFYSGGAWRDAGP